MSDNESRWRFRRQARIAPMALMALVLLASGCVNRQGAFASAGATRGCYGVALETRTAKLDGGAASWYSNSPTCDFANQGAIATYVQVAVTIQGYNPWASSWVNCTHTKIVSNYTGSIQFDFNENWGGDWFQGGICGGSTFSGDPATGYTFATNAGHVVRLNGNNQFTNQAVTEVAA